MIRNHLNMGWGPLGGYISYERLCVVLFVIGIWSQSGPYAGGFLLSARLKGSVDLNLAFFKFYILMLEIESWFWYFPFFSPKSQKSHHASSDGYHTLKARFIF
jgi:hypothetical protein